MWRFILFLFLNVSGQSTQIFIEYDYKDSNINRTDTLIATNLNMVFSRGNSYRDIGFSKRKSTINVDSEIKSNRLEVNLSSSISYAKVNSDSLFIHTTINERKSLILDVIPQVDWIISNEFKEILGIKCRKATCLFRGSNITAWYSENIKIPFGPYKFKGLPGIILEVYNEGNLNMEKWKAKKIDFPYQEKVNYKSIKYNNTEFINYEEVVKNREKKINNQIARLKSRTPNGVTMQNSSIQRIGIERHFEWETEDEEKK